MAKRRKPHIIRDQVLNITINGNVSDADIRRLQDEVTTLFKINISTIIEKQLDAISNDDLYIELPALELDLPSISYVNPKQFQRQIQNSLEEGVQKAIKENLRKITKTDNPQKQKKIFSKPSILFYFLLNGHFPHWVGPHDWTVRQLISTVIESDIALVNAFMARYQNRPNVMTRIENQFDDQHLKILVSYIFGRNATRVFKNLSTLHYAGKSKIGYSKDLYVAALKFALDPTTSQAKTAINDRSFSRYVIHQLESTSRPVIEDRYVISEFKRSFSDLQLLGYFFTYGAVPYWGSLESKGSLRTLFSHQVKNNLIRVQNLIESNFNSSSFIDRLIYQIDSDDLLLLLEPTPKDNVEFIKELRDISAILTSAQTSIEQVVSPNAQKKILFRSALSYFIKDGKKRFIKKTFLLDVLEQLSAISKTPVNEISKLLYRTLKRKGKASILKGVLEELDGRLQREISSEKKEQKRIRRSIQSYKKRLLQIQKQLKSKRLSSKLTKQLEQDRSKILSQIESLEQQLEDDTLEQLDFQLLEKDTLLAKIDEKGVQINDLLENPILNRINTDLGRLFNRTQRTVDQMERDQLKFSKRPSSLLKKKLTKNRIRLLQLDQRLLSFDQSLNKDKLQVTFLLSNLRLSIREAKSAEEGRRLRQERTRLEKHLSSLNDRIHEVLTVREQIKEVVAAIEKTQESEQEQILPSRTSKLDYLVFLLKYGSTPWWAESYEGVSIDEIVADFAQNDLQKLRRALQTVGRYDVAWNRFSQQLSDRTRNLLIDKVYPRLRDQIQDLADMFGVIHQADHFKGIQSTFKKEFSWRVLLESLFRTDQPYTGKNLLTEVVKQLSERYQISAVKLINAIHSISTNRPDRFGRLQQLSKRLLENEIFKEIDRRLIKTSRERTLKEKGTFLTASQKQDIILSFLQTNKIPKDGLDNDIKDIAKVEQMILEQIDTSHQVFSKKLQTLLRQQSICELIVSQFSTETQEEIIHMLNPRAIIASKKLLADLSQIQNDTILLPERVLLLNYVAYNTSRFDIEEYLTQVITLMSTTSQRDMVTIIEQWKQDARQQIKTSQSTLYLKLLSIQSASLKQEIKQSSDKEFVESVKEQVRYLAEELSQYSSEFMDKLTADAFDMDTSLVPPRNPLILEKEIAKTKQLIQSIEQKLEKVSSAVEKNALTRDLLRAKSMLKKQEWQMPSQIKYYTKQQQQNITRQKELQQQIETSLTDENLYEDTTIDSLLATLFTLKKQLQSNDKNAVQSLSKIIDELTLPENSRMYQSQLDEIRQQVAQKENQPFFKDINRLFENITPILPDDLPLLDDQVEFESELLKIQSSIRQEAPHILLERLVTLRKTYTDIDKLSVEKWSKIEQIVQQRYVNNVLSLFEIMYVKQDRMDVSIRKTSSLEDLERLKNNIAALRDEQEKERSEINAQMPKSLIKKLSSHLQSIPIVLDNLERAYYRRRKELLEQQKNTLIQERDLLKIRQKELIQEIDLLKDEYKLDTKEEEKPPEIKKQKTVKPPKVEEPLLVNNGGLVLLWPFFTRLFAMTKLVVDKEFVDEAAQIKAVQMLQYLVSGKLEAAENELVLNKVFVGLPLNTPIPFEFDLSQEETKMLDSLIMGALTNWSRIKGMGSNGFRSTFLLREGSIEEGDESWKVVIIKKQLDVLLKTIPWGYSFIKLPWLKKVITVEWPIM